MHFVESPCNSSMEVFSVLVQKFCRSVSAVTSSSILSDDRVYFVGSRGSLVMPLALTCRCSSSS